MIRKNELSKMKKLKLFILSEKRKKALPSFASWKDVFYLAGGTGLALQIGHRESVDFDFFSRQPFATDYLNVASIPDIACMKLSTIMQRCALKDYVDLYEIMKIYSLTQLLSFAKKKYPVIDSTVILKSLTYLDDITDEPLQYQTGQKKPQLDVLKIFFQNEVKKYMSSIITPSSEM